MFLFKKKIDKVPDNLKNDIINEINNFLGNISEAVNSFKGDFNNLTLNNLEMHRVKLSLNQASLNLDKIRTIWSAKNNISVSLSKLLELEWETYKINIEWRMLTLNDDFDIENYSHREKYHLFVIKNRTNEKNLIKCITDLKSAYKEVFNSDLDI
ncbi:MAG: hypothetical protein C0391_05385 [Anaerolinea sp.]|nr:hypothetical protein [Anaerolinea sp.]